MQAAVIAALDGPAAHTPFRFEPKGSQLITDKESTNLHELARKKKYKQIGVDSRRQFADA